MNSIPAQLAAHREIIARLLRDHPYLSVEPGSAAIEDENSALYQIRKDSIVTGSMAGILWNCKRGTSRSQYLLQKAGLVAEPEVSDFAKTCMAAGREWEPKINEIFATAMAAEFRRIWPENGLVGIWLPGPFVLSLGLGFDAPAIVSATADGMLTFLLNGKYRMLHYELKFFASKAVLPETLPEDYLAQVLLQMCTGGTSVSLLVGAVLCDGIVLMRCWIMRRQPEHTRDVMVRLRQLYGDLQTVSVNARCRTKKEGFALHDLVVAVTDNCLEIWGFLEDNADDLFTLWPSDLN